MSAVVSKVTKRRSGILSVFGGSPIMGPLAALMLASIFFATQSDRFLTGANLSLILQQVMVVGTLAIGQTLVILTSGIDLSNGADHGPGLGPHDQPRRRSRRQPDAGGPASASAYVSCFGLLNGALVTGIRLPAFIVTLGTYNIAFALTRIYTTSTITGLPASAALLRQHLQGGRHADHLWFGADDHPLHYCLVHPALDAGGTLRLRRRRQPGSGPPGRHQHQPRAAGRLHDGRPDLRHRRSAAGGPHRRWRPASRPDSNLESITAVVLGGTSLFGGRGTHHRAR